MQQYRLYFLDRKDVIVTGQDFLGADDLAALQEAERLCDTHAIEIWCGTRRVARVNKHNAPLKTEDRQSL